MYVQQLLTSRKDGHKKLLRTDNVAIGYLPAIDKYAFYVRNWAPPPGQESRGPTRRVGLCLTDDLRDFGAPRDVFGLDAPADPSLPPTEVYTGGAFLYEGWWLFYPTFLAEFGPHEKVGAPPWGLEGDGLLDVRFLHGGDGETAPSDLHWSPARTARRPVLSLGVNRCTFNGSTHEPGGWCSPTSGDYSLTAPATGQSYMNAGMIVSANGEELRLFANLHPFSHGAGVIRHDPSFAGGSTQPNEGIYAYTLRRDGFGSVLGGYGGTPAEPQHGEITTVPIALPACNSSHDDLQLRLNLVSSVSGAVRAELRDVEGAPLPGYELAASDAIRGNFVDRTVGWGDPSGCIVLHEKKGCVASACASETALGVCDGVVWHNVSCATTAECNGRSCDGVAAHCVEGMCAVDRGGGAAEHVCATRARGSYRQSLRDLRGRQAVLHLDLVEAELFAATFTCAVRHKSDDHQTVSVACTNRTDSTDELQSALNRSNATVKIAPVGGLCITRPLSISHAQNLRVLLAPGVLIQALRGGPNQTRPTVCVECVGSCSPPNCTLSTLISIVESANITVEGLAADENTHRRSARRVDGLTLREVDKPTIHMWREDYADTSLYIHSEHRHVISFYGVKDFVLRNVRVAFSGGDGVEVDSCSNGTLERVTSDHNCERSARAIAPRGPLTRTVAANRPTGPLCCWRRGVELASEGQYFCVDQRNAARSRLRR